MSLSQVPVLHSWVLLHLRWVSIEILVLILVSSEDSDKSALICQSFHCSHTQSMDVDEGKFRPLALLDTMYICVSSGIYKSHSRICDKYKNLVWLSPGYIAYQFIHVGSQPRNCFTFILPYQNID